MPDRQYQHQHTHTHQETLQQSSRQNGAVVAVNLKYLARTCPKKNRVVNSLPKLSAKICPRGLAPCFAAALAALGQFVWKRKYNSRRKKWFQKKRYVTNRRRAVHGMSHRAAASCSCLTSFSFRGFTFLVTGSAIRRGEQKNQSNALFRGHGRTGKPRSHAAT